MIKDVCADCNNNKISYMSSVPSRIREGMLLLSGDVLLLFNPLQIDFPGRGAAAISFKENVETGKNHGVFLNSEDGNVKKFLHKQTVETLRQMGAVNENDCVDIDTGAVIFSTDMLSSFLHVGLFRQRVAAWMRSLLVWVADLKCIQK